MGYKIKVQMMDSVIEFEAEKDRDNRADSITKGATKLGIPIENIIVTKIDTEYSDFLGKDIEKIIEVNQ